MKKNLPFLTTYLPPTSTKKIFILNVIRQNWALFGPPTYSRVPNNNAALLFF